LEESQCAVGQRVITNYFFLVSTGATSTTDAPTWFNSQLPLAVDCLWRYKKISIQFALSFLATILVYCWVETPGFMLGVQS
jgi:hypothetical protein